MGLHQQECPIMLSLDVTDFFKNKLAQIKPGYVLRQSQVELSQAIEEAIVNKSTLIAEAGTGTGKTWAYLVPAFASLGKVIVSTGTRALQDQLFRKDAPFLKKAMSLPVHISLLKGRGNYLCHFHYHRIADDPEAQFKDKHEAAQFQKIKLFFKQTKTGDKSDCFDVPDNAPIWSRVTSTKENCLNKDCPFIESCFVAKARKEAKEADVVVVNHALFFADIALRQEADIDLLPVADTVIFDEAHQLPDTATQFLGSSLYLTELRNLLKEIEIHTTTHAKQATEWGKLCKIIETHLHELRLIARDIDDMPGKKAVFDHLPDADNFLQELDKTFEDIEVLQDALAKVAESHIDLQEVFNRLNNQFLILHQWRYPEKYQQEDKNTYVRWVEFGTHQLRFSRAPLSVKNFANFKRAEQAWILTSATLSVNKQFSHFQAQLGLFEADCHSWESPFRYDQKAIMYVPDHLPNVKELNYEQELIRLVTPLIEKTPGGTLVLCTTLKAVDSLADLLHEALAANHSQRQVLRQGEASHRVLIDRFRQEGNAILVGSASFWEGVDFPGDLLTLVVIDRLPFAPPDDPVLEARIEECRKRGGNPFMEIQIPMATITLKQGVGRLIRTENDCGILVIGDARLVNQRYSKLLWNSLPNFHRTRNLQDVLGFWG